MRNAPFSDNDSLSSQTTKDTDNDENDLWRLNNSSALYIKMLCL